MSPLVFSLVLASALLHITWNSLAKATPDKEAFAWLTSMGGILFLLVAYLASSLVMPGVPMSMDTLALAALSALFQTAYVIFLFAAYAAIDLSVVYPVNRGAAPLIVMGAATFFVGDNVTPLQAVGVLAAALGAMVVGFTNKPDGLSQNQKNSIKGIPLCLLTAASTAGYILTDRFAMGSATPSRVLDYLFVVYLFQGVGLTLWMLFKRPRMRGVFGVFKKNVRSVVLVSIFVPLSYLCIVAALEYGNVTLISAGRNVGILFSAVAGRLFFNEQVSRNRGLGTLCVFGGLVLIAVTPG